MLLLSRALKEKKLDLRIVDKNLDRGAVTPQELDKNLKELPDDAENAEWLSQDDIQG